MSEVDTTSKNEVPFAAVARDDLDFVNTLNDVSVHGFVSVDTIKEREDGSMFFSGWIVREGPTELTLAPEDSPRRKEF